MPDYGFLQHWQPREIERQLLGIPRYLRMITVGKLLIGGIALLLAGLVIVLPLLHKDESAFRIVFTQMPESSSSDLPRMMNPRFEGVDSKDQPFTIRASEAVQADADTVQMQNIQADVALNNGSWLALRSKQGALQIAHKRLFLKGDVQLFSSDGNEVFTQDIYVDLAGPQAIGRQQVRAQGPLGSLRADHFRFSGEPQVLTFVGNVKLVLYP